QARDGSPHGRVIVHNKDGVTKDSHQAILLLLISTALPGRPVGRLKWRVAPQSALFVAQSFPRCAAMMVRQTESPSPIPLAFVVKKGSKICSILSCGMLPPRSVTDTISVLLPFSVSVRISSRRSEALQSAIASQALTTRLSNTC